MLLFVFSSDADASIIVSSNAGSAAFANNSISSSFFIDGFASMPLDESRECPSPLGAMSQRPKTMMAVAIRENFKPEA